MWNSIETVTGDRPDTCPWIAFTDPFVREVLDAYRACQTPDGATPALLLPADPPHAVWLGLLHYTRSKNLADADRRKREREAAEKSRTHG